MWIVASLPALAGGIQAFGNAVLTHSPAAAAFRVAWPTMRTFGYITERLTAGLDPRTAATGRALTMPPFMGSFLSGIAYDTAAEAAEGWLAWWAEAFVPGTLGNRMTFTLVDALQEGDWIRAGDIIVDSFAELKIEEPLKFINGLFRVLADIENIAGAPFAFTSLTTLLSDFLRRLSLGEVLDLGDIIDEAEDFFEDLGEVLKPGWRPGEAIPVPAGGPELSEGFIRTLEGLNSTLGIVGASIEPIAKLATTAFGWDKEKMENDAALLKKLVALFGKATRVGLKGRGLGRPRFPAPLPPGGQPREFD